jgi:transcriptional regulator with XRE-family HTH domain
MPRRRDPLRPPREYVRGEWPHAVIPEDAPLAVSYMQRLAVAIRQAIEEQGITHMELSDRINLDRSTLRLLLNGYTWPDMVTITRLEHGLGRTLWPTFHYDVRPMKARIAAAIHDQLGGCTHDRMGKDCEALAEAAIMAL